MDLYSAYRIRKRSMLSVVVLFQHGTAPRYLQHCRCNVAPSSAVNIFVRPGGSDNVTNYDRRPSFRRRGTSCMEQSSPIRLDCSSSDNYFRKYLNTYLFSVFTIILIFRARNCTLSVIGVGAQSTLGGTTFLREKYV